MSRFELTILGSIRVHRFFDARRLCRYSTSLGLTISLCHNVVLSLSLVGGAGWSRGLEGQPITWAWSGFVRAHISYHEVLLGLLQTSHTLASRMRYSQDACALPWICFTVHFVRGAVAD
jgi:hypothetical protein